MDRIRIESGNVLKEKMDEVRRPSRTLNLDCKIPGIVIFTCGLLLGAIGVGITQSFVAAPRTRHVASPCNISGTTDVSLEVTVPIITSQSNNTSTVMEATEGDLATVPSTSALTCEEASKQQQARGCRLSLPVSWTVPGDRGACQC
ncbi:uncharacterized protein LOC123511291 [Portunus trituberculatus]|uniref:uncharacterized protein LOC123511291 n=1 Tax=Portunus trituberculatus TaxID=210409 RepID=UPI001E1CDE45|nr:uncharacterized protein LOC123511291 [Portunus trituberculatus]